jgi:hypothetical protein
VDGDLHFDGTIDDGGAVSGAGRLLYEFDRSDDPASPSTFVGIAGDLDGADAPARWTIQEFDYRDDIRKANGIRSDDDGEVRNDEDGDGIVDTPYDVTLSQQWNTSLAPGESVTFVTRTLFGREPPQNQTPVAVADALTTAEDTAGIVDVLANDSDPDGDTVSLVGATNGAHGSVTCDGGRCTYTPAADYNGADSFTYTVTDTHGATASGSVDVTVTPVDEPKQTLTVTKVGNARITSTPAGIDCGDVCTAEFEVGTVVTLTATPDPGWAFAGWSGACAGSTTCVVTVDAGKAVTASFELPPPTPTQNVNVTPVSGEVFVKLPGSTQFVPLTEPSQVPMGSQIDATRGRVELKSGRDAGVTEVSTFYDGAFEMTQAAAADLVELRLILGDFSVCAQPSLQAANKNTRPIRRLWGNGKGKYRTRGKYSSATVRGTIWKTEDRCDGTLTKVDEGSVTVRDFGRQLNIVVKAPKSYLAEPLPRGVSGAGCTIIGTSRRDVLRGTPRRDVICGLAGNDVLVGLGGNDKLLGGDGNDRLNGGRGNDVLDGGAGRDWMDGGPGVDVLRGGRGIDFLVSSGKPDRLHGGPGADRCRARTVRACP